jgi:HK97 family phage portal protein
VSKNTLTRYFEKRSHPSSPDQWLINFFGGGRKATSGVQVSETSALSWTALWAGVRFLAETMASLPLDVMERIGEKKDTLRLHPIALLYAHGPNEEQTWLEFLEMMVAQMVMWGTCYAHIIWNGRGEPIALWPLHFDRVTPKRVNGKLWWQVSVPDESYETSSNIRMIPAEDMLVIRGFATSGICGEKIASVFKEAIGLGLATEQFIGHFFGQGANASGFLSHPGKLTKPAFDRLKESINQQTGSLENSHHYMILEEAMQWHQLSVDPDKAQALGLRQFQIQEASRILRISPHHLGDLSRATFSNIEQMGIETVVYTLMPWAVRIESRLNKQLVSEPKKNLIYTKFNMRALLRGDSAAQSVAFHNGVQDGYLSPNDIREMLDMNPIPKGNTYLQPVNMAPLGTVPAPVPASAPTATNGDIEEAA